MSPIDEENAWLYACRLDWYTHKAVPPTMQFLMVPREGPDEPSDLRRMDRREICDWLVAHDGEPQQRTAVMWARNMRTPQEEMDRLVRLERVKADEVGTIADEDPYGGFKSRLAEYSAHMGGGGR